MKFTLKNLKHAEFASEETHCFQATLYIDGKRFCQVSNDGHGGCDNYYPSKTDLHQNKLYSRIKEINEELGKEIIPTDLPDIRGEPFVMNNSLEIVVGDLINEELTNRDIKKVLRKVVYIKPDCAKGQYYSLKGSVKPSPHVFAQLKAAKWWKDSFVILNELSFEQAKAYL